MAFAAAVDQVRMLVAWISRLPSSSACPANRTGHVCWDVRRLWRDHRPAATGQLGRQLLGWNAPQRLLDGRPHRAGPRGCGGAPVRLALVESFDQRGCLVPGELPSGLALGEPHRAPRVAEAAVPEVLEQAQQLLDVFR